MNVNYGYAKLVLKSNNLEMMDKYIGADIVMWTMPGKSLVQSARWKLPVIVLPLWQRGMPEGCSMMVRRNGEQFELYEDANDVAGLSELIADRGKAKVPALR